MLVSPITSPFARVAQGSRADHRPSVGVALFRLCIETFQRSEEQLTGFVGGIAQIVDNRLLDPPNITLEGHVDRDALVTAVRFVLVTTKHVVEAPCAGAIEANRQS